MRSRRGIGPLLRFGGRPGVQAICSGRSRLLAILVLVLGVAGFSSPLSASTGQKSKKIAAIRQDFDTDENRDLAQEMLTCMYKHMAQTAADHGQRELFLEASYPWQYNKQLMEILDKVPDEQLFIGIEILGQLLELSKETAQNYYKVAKGNSETWGHPPIQDVLKISLSENLRAAVSSARNDLFVDISRVMPNEPKGGHWKAEFLPLLNVAHVDKNPGEGNRDALRRNINLKQLKGVRTNQVTAAFFRYVDSQKTNVSR